MKINSYFFSLNGDLSTNSTRNINGLHALRVNTSLYKNGGQYSGIKIFNALPDSIKCIKIKRLN